MQTLDVVNTMLGTRGERPLSSLSTPHRLSGPCQALIVRTSTELFAKGWWFNEEKVTLAPNPTDKYVYIANDALGLKNHAVTVVKRGSRLYDLAKGTYEHTSPIECTLVRFLPLEQLPETAAAYLAAEAVFRFQRDYDGDSTKTRQLLAERNQAKVEAVSEEIRMRKYNAIDSNATIQRFQRR
jgi:hypothetical protein